MMRLIVFFLLLWQPICYSQCNGRYLDEIFTDVDVSTVTYSEVNNLQLDIYQPVGDTEGNRPLIILAHGGSFIAGVRTNPSMVSLGESFAKRGYVVASISYRLMAVWDLIFSSSTLNGVAEALSDGKAAIRYFRKSVAQGNEYNIDPNQIYFGGNSAGAIIAIHAAFMQEGEVEDPELIVAMENNGGFEGNSGNPGFSSDVRGAISLAGGIANLDFINSSDFNSLLITCHGNLDNTVLYDCGEPLSGTVPIELCGGGAILEHSSLIGFENHHHLLFEGEDHTPWAWSGPIENQMISFVSENLFNNLDCANSTRINDGDAGENVFILPNPVHDQFSVSGFNNYKSVSIKNLYGKTVYRKENDSTNNNIDFLPAGLYIVELLKENEQSVITKKIIKL